MWFFLFQYEYLFNNGPLPENMRDTENPYQCEEEGQADEDDGERSGRGEDDIGGNPADKNGSKRKSMSKKKEKTSQYYRLKPPPRIITNELDLENK